MFLNRCIFIAASGGTGTFTVSSAATGFVTPATAGAPDGVTLSYTAQSSDLTQWEVGQGVYSSGTLTRATVFANSAGGTSALNFTNAPQVLITGLAIDFREVLTADRTYYVATTGSDSNSGLAVGSPFATFAHALATIKALDGNGHAATIQVADGTYTESINVTGPFVGFKSISLLGNLTTPANVVISTTATCIFIGDPTFAQLTLVAPSILYGGFKLTSSAGSGIDVEVPGTVVMAGKMEFGACFTAHCVVGIFGGYLEVTGFDYTISGGAKSHFLTQFVGEIYSGSQTVTLTGTPNFTAAFAKALDMGQVISVSAIFSGSATGVRYEVGSNALIETSGGGANFFPGNSAGVVNDASGVYL